MYRKTAILTFVFVVVSSIALWAQSETPEEHKKNVEKSIERQVKTLTEKLELTEEQSKTIKKLITAREKVVDDVFEMLQSGAQIDSREMLQKGVTDYEKGVEKLLTAKQKEAYEKYLKERK